jgi:ATP-binding cassette subfamily B protein
VRTLDQTKCAARRWRSLAILLWRAAGWRAVAIAAFTVVRGLLPMFVIFSIGLLGGAVPGAVAHGLDSPEGTRALLALALVGAAFLAHGACDALATYTGRVLATRYALTVHDTVARCALTPASVKLLEEPAVVAEFAAVEEYERTGVYRDGIWYLQFLVSFRTQAVAVFVVLLGFRWWAPVVLLAGWLMVNWAGLRWIKKGIEAKHVESGAGLRRARYMRGLAVEPGAAKEIRIFGLGGWAVEQYTRGWRVAMTELWRSRKAGWSGIGLALAAHTTAHVLVLGALSSAALRGDVSVAALVVFVQAVLVSGVQGPAGEAQWTVGQVLLGADKVLQLEARTCGARSTGSDEHPMRVGPPRPPGPTRSATEVRLQRVSFTYPSRTRPTLEGLDLVVPASQSLGLVGENGVGKTTLIKLLCGLYQPDSGRVVLSNGVDGSLGTPPIAVIFQDFTRYDLSLRENVGLGCPALAADDAAIEMALRDAGAFDLLDSLPAGLDTVLSPAYDSGTELSGGQWQRVALARALLAVHGGAGLLVLDEPTANLDVRAEVEVFERLLDVTRGLTTILVSHRLSSVRRVDRIAVIAEGRVVEEGKHDELMARGGRYAAMYTLQAQRFVSSSTVGNHLAHGEQADDANA